MADLENGVTSLWLRARARRPTSTPCSRACFLDLAPVVLDAPTDPMAAAMALLTRRRGHRAPPRPPTSAIPAEQVTADGWPAWPTATACSAFVVDATPVHDRGASDVQELAHSMHVGGGVPPDRSPAAGSRSTTRPRWSSSGTPPPTSSSRPSPSSAPPAGCGRGCSSSAGRRGATTQRQHAVTSRPMMSAVRPLGRTCCAPPSPRSRPASGGADAVTVLPFDSPLGRPTPSAAGSPATPARC